MAESNDEWFDDLSGFPDEVFEARLRDESRIRTHLWELYTNGASYVRGSVEGLLDSIKFLYGEAVSSRTRVLIERELTCGTTLREMGLCLSLHAENPWTPHGRIDLLQSLNINIQDVLETRDYCSNELTQFWDFQCRQDENLEVVEVHIEAVHGILIRYDFRNLLDRVRENHATLLEAVIAILGHRYNLYPSWRTMAREPSSALPRPPVDWGSVSVDPRPDASW
jgi:hypothetical protein